MTSDCVQDILSEIYKNFGRGEFEFYQMARISALYLVGLHTRLGNDGYIVLAKRTTNHHRIWRLSDKALELIGKK